MAEVRGKELRKVAINLMNTCRATRKDAFTFSRGSFVEENALLISSCPAAASPNEAGSLAKVRACVSVRDREPLPTN